MGVCRRDVQYIGDKDFVCPGRCRQYLPFFLTHFYFFSLVYSFRSTGTELRSPWEPLCRIQVKTPVSCFLVEDPDFGSTTDLPRSHRLSIGSQSHEIFPTLIITIVHRLCSYFPPVWKALLPIFYFPRSPPLSSKAQLLSHLLCEASWLPHADSSLPAHHSGALCTPLSRHHVHTSSELVESTSVS